MVHPASLRISGFNAEVLIPGMARVDATVMDRIRGLRFIHQWGAGLEGVDSPRANGPSNRVANVRSTGGNGSG